MDQSARSFCVRTTRKRFRAVLISCFAVIFSVFVIVEPVALHAQSQGIYILNTPTSAPLSTHDGKGFLDLLIKNAFQRIGLKGRVVEYSASKRALINANADIDQGVAMRVKGLEALYPNLVRVPEPVFDVDFVAFSLDQSVDASSWKALRDIPVAYILGWFLYEENLLPGTDAITVKKPEQLFALLKKHRVDAILYERWMGLHKARQLGIRVTVNEPPLARVNMYIYLNKKHIKLVAKLVRALRAMKADGTYQLIYDETLTKTIASDLPSPPWAH